MLLSAKERQGAMVRLVIPAAASSSLPSQEKTPCFHCRHTPSSWAGGNAPGSAAGSAARASPCPLSPPMVGRHGARPWEERSKECTPAGLPTLAAPCLPQASSWAQTLSQWGMAGCGVSPTGIPLINTPGTAAVPPTPGCLPHPSSCAPCSSHATLCGTQGWQGRARQGLGTRCPWADCV